MCKFSSVILILSILLSCSNHTESDFSVETVEVETEGIDSNKVVLLPDTIVTVIKTDSFHYFEDYARLKTKSKLYETFDSIYLKDDVTWYAEGTVKVEVTYLNNPRNNHVVKYGWNEDNSDKLDFIEADYFNFNTGGAIVSGRKIESRTGLSLGMSLNELETWNGDIIRFFGFSWDYEGTILNNADDLLSEIPITIKLSLDYDNPSDADDALMGDIEFSSADSTVKKASIVIDRFTFNL